MDHHSHRPQVQTHEQDGGGGGNSSKGGGGSGNSNFLCKQNNSRWTPTTDQIRILKELYYNNGVRSPSADQIQRITARLRQYGKIEGKNVFYWFQNHKARERQKKRLTNTTPSTTTSDLHPHHHYHMSMPPMQRSSISFNGVSSSPSSSAGVIGVGQMGSFGSYGSVTMEKSFRECSISSAASGSNINWFGMDPYYASSYNNTGLVFDRTPNPSVKESFDFYGQYHHGDGEHDHEDDGDGRSASPPGVETLPLFPMHGEGGIIDGFHRIEPESDGGHGYYAATSGRTSLELSLCSFTGQFPDS